LVDDDNLGDFDFLKKSQNASVTFAWFRREILIKFAFNAVEALGTLRRIALNGDVRPFGGIFRIDLEPFVEARLSIRLDGIGWTFRLANATIDAFIGVDHQHVFAFIEAIYRTNFHAIHIFAFDAVFSDDVGHDLP
jgi:hypothetical protein